jgi:hypothetical protein
MDETVVIQYMDDLAGAHATKLGHYPDVGGTVKDGRRHRGRDDGPHPTADGVSGFSYV